ncbi:MAG: sulfotransferase family protein [Ignavibacteria bacterium]|nr:sulfotransferase family protein [Ignavibacteria bacterium]
MLKSVNSTERLQFDFHELKSNFGGFTFSTKEQLRLFSEDNARIELFRGMIQDENISILEYQQLFAFYLLRKFTPQQSRVLIISGVKSRLSEVLADRFEFWKLDDIASLTKDFEPGSYPKIFREDNPDETLPVPFNYFDVIISFGDIIGTVPNDFFESKYRQFNSNLNMLTRPGGVNLHCLPVSFTEDWELRFSLALFSLHKEIFVMNNTVIDYAHPFSAKEAHSLLAFNSDLKPGTTGTKAKFKKSFSYNVLTHKHPALIREFIDSNQPLYRKKRPAYFFHHLIKCGGSSLGVALEKWFEFREDLYDDGAQVKVFQNNLDLFKKFKYNLETLYSDVCIRGHFQHDGIHIHQRYPEIFGREDIRVFTFIRDPFDVLISLYYFGKKRDYDYQNLSLKDYLSVTKNFLAKIIPCDETNYRERIDRYFFVGIVERIQESFDKLADLIGKKRMQVGRYNTTEKDDQVRNLSPEFIEWVKNENSLDYKIYNYAIEKFNRI